MSGHSGFLQGSNIGASDSEDDLPHLIENFFDDKEFSKFTLNIKYYLSSWKRTEKDLIRI